MKTLADLKRAMTVGTVVDVVNHMYPNLSGTRTVLIAQTQRWCLSIPEGHPRYEPGKGSWMDIPKAGRCTFNGSSVTITRDPEWKDTGPFVTITVPGATGQG